MHAEREARRDLGKRRVGALAAGQAVGDDPDLMAAVGLAVGEIDDVAENAAHRRAHRVQDSERSIWRGHGQNRPSPAPFAAARQIGRGGRGTGSGASARHEATLW